MTRTSKLAASIVLIFLLATVLALGWRQGWLAKASGDVRPSSSTAVVTTASRSARPVTPAPSISLQINSEHELTVISGTPLIFTVRLGNRYAQNAVLRNEVSKHHSEQLRAAVASGEISQDRADRLLASLGKPVDIPVLSVGNSALGWDQFVRFTLWSHDGQQQALPWSLTLVSPPTAKLLTLDGQTTGQVEYLLAPDSASKASVGSYEILAALDVPANAKLPSDRWRGHVQSDPVKLTIVPKRARLSQTEEEEWNLQFARYYVKANDPAQGLQWARRALTVNGKSIPARVLMGEAKEAQGDLKGALESYQAALVEFHKQHPNSYEAPLYLIHKTSDLFAKLRE